MSETLRWVIWGLVLGMSNLGTWFLTQRIFVKRIAKGVQVLLRLELERLSKHCHRKGYSTIEEKHQYENIYNIYHSLCKNGVMDVNRKQFLELPDKK